MTGVGDTITVFGNRERHYDFFNSACIKRVVFTSGKVKNCVREINASLSLGLNPVLFRAAVPSPVTTDGDQVYAPGRVNVSERDLSEEAALYTWKASHYYSHEFNYLAFSAEFASMEYNIFDWFPKVAVEHFFAESTCHYYFSWPFEGLDEFESKPIGLTNRVSDRYHARARNGDKMTLKPILETERQGKMALEVLSASLTIEGVDFATHQDTAVIFAATFYVDKPRPKKQMLVSTKYCRDRGIYLMGDKCYWLGSKNLDSVGLDIYIKAWNFVFLLLDQRGAGLIQVNDTVQRFETKRAEDTRSLEVVLFASTYGPALDFRGQIAEIVIFNKQYLPCSGVPTQLREQLHQHFMSRVEEGR